jgi:DNA polymerase I-like protein with 3'-5' exonuclease and polymerase domains
LPQEAKQTREERLLEVKRIVVDIETDSLDATTIHCVVIKEDSKVYAYTHANMSDCVKHIEAADIIVMHNGVSFDAPVLKRLLNVNIPLSKIRDTLIMSQMANPVRDGGHSLEAWGNTLGYPKIEYEDFTCFSEDMLKYCVRDVEITDKVYKALLPSLKMFSPRSIKLEHQIRAVIDQQERNGFQLNVKEAMLLMGRLSDEAEGIKADLQNKFPPITEVRYSDKTGKRLKDKVTIFNPASRKQIAERLSALGWEPHAYTDKGQAIVSEEVLEKVDIPEAQIVARYLLLEKRVSQIKSWIDAADDEGKVHGRVLTLRTITGRMAHTSPNMAQIPAVYSPYGKECRDVWTTSSDGYVLLGCDASSLELRCLAHYMNDTGFTKEVVDGDVHTANQRAAGLPTRDNAKTFIYAFLYGAGPAKIGKIVNGSAKDGKKLIDTFLTNMPALKVLRNKVAKLATRGYVVGIDGRILQIRSEHAALNTLLQGAGAIICKEWLKYIILQASKRNLDYKLVASIHDEYQFEVRKDHAEEFGEVTRKAMKLTEESLKVRCPLDSEYKVGKTWAETH